MKRCIINFANSNGPIGYIMGQKRLEDSLKAVNFDGDVFIFKNENEIGCSPHKDVPYGFKAFAFKSVIEKGYDSILWCDSSVWAIKPLDGIFNEIETNGYCMFHNCNTGPFSSDASLQSFGITREEAFQIPMLMGCCFGLNMTTNICKEFYNRFFEKANDGITFQGSWTNKNNEISNDSRVYGHRHDQTASSIIAHQLGMKFITPHLTYFQYYQNPTNESYEKNPNMSMIYTNVLLLAQGM